MWPFSRNKAEKTEEPESRNVYREHQEYLNRVAPIGKEFLYMGVQMRVAKYECQHWLMLSDVIAEYVDKTGVIREKTFQSEHLHELIPGESVESFKRSPRQTHHGSVHVTLDA